MEQKESVDQQLIKTLQDMRRMISSSRKKFGVYDNFQDLVLREGQIFIPCQKPRGIKFGKVKDCFSNATNLVLDREDLFYVEGFASIELIAGLPFAHAWATDSRGIIIDNTWRTSGTAYLGVVFGREYLRKKLLETRQYGILDYPNVDILEKGFPEGALIKIAGLPSVQRIATMAC